MVDQSFKIRIVNIKKIVYISRGRVKCLNDIGLIIIRKRNKLKTNRLQEEHNLYTSEYQQFACITY